MPRSFPAFLSLLALVSCATHAPLPLPKGLLELEGTVAAVAAGGAWLGAVVAPNESDSLEDLEIRPGVRVIEVAAGSPAARAGLRVGDVLLALDGTPVDDPGRLVALLAGIEAPAAATLDVERGTAVLALDARLEARPEDGGVRFLYHVDRALVRAAFHDTHDDGAFPAIAHLAEDSPLREAGAEVGDRVVSFRGHDPGSAAELVRRLRLELEPGEPAEVRLRAPDGAERTLHFRAWSPGRELIASSFWPLWSWERRREERRESLLIGDLILLSLFRRDAVGHEAEYSILSLIHWRTGEALLESSLAPGAEGGE